MPKTISIIKLEKILFRILFKEVTNSRLARVMIEGRLTSPIYPLKIDATFKITI
jgi:hypothetical protein